jgi:hypothetical protein
MQLFAGEAWRVLRPRAALHAGESILDKSAPLSGITRPDRRGHPQGVGKLPDSTAVLRRQRVDFFQQLTGEG